MYVCIYRVNPLSCAQEGPRPTWGIRGTRNKIRVFYSNLACFVNTATLNMYVFMSYAG